MSKFTFPGQILACKMGEMMNKTLYFIFMTFICQKSKQEE
jgi:hypothetical protein